MKIKFSQKMKFSVIPATAILIMAFVSACYYDSEEYLYPQVNDLCDTVNVTYTLSVIPILDYHCYTCHSNATSPTFGGNIKLENYTDLMIQVNNGRLMESVKHSSGSIPMPKDAPKIEDCKIAILQIWIDADALNN